jgi:hypothetical protein
MGRIVSACAYANNEVAYIAWNIDAVIEGCLGFEVTRVILDDQDQEVERTRCATWVGFKGQRNPEWLPQDSGIWPVQKLSWRDLTLRKRRAEVERRRGVLRVRYEIRPVGDWKAGLDKTPDPAPKMATVVVRDADKRPIKVDGVVQMKNVPAYEGRPRQLGYLARAISTNAVTVTRRRGAFQSTFTNGILAAQWLSHVLLEDGVIGPDELYDKIANPNDPHRQYLAGEVLPLLHELLDKPGRFYLALYELEDAELQDLLVRHAAKLHVILSNSGEGDSGWDDRNAAARHALRAAGVDLQDRMFNNSGQIGHNKFVVHVPPDGQPRSVFTGSTNWTSTGVAGQSNNALLIEDDTVAAAFLDYWGRMHDDVIPAPAPVGPAENPFNATMNASYQGARFRSDNAAPQTATMTNGASVTTWFSPNMTSRRKGKTTPPDLVEVYRRMRQARDAILFLAFYPGQSGNDCIIGEAVEIGLKDRSLIVIGAVSSPNAMPNYAGKKKGDPNDDGDDIKAVSPFTFSQDNVEIVRAAKIDDRMLLEDFGLEKATAKAMGAIIHDKICVIDPLSDNCSVILGSHNLGYKASYGNDENMVIVSGDKALAQAYAVHVLDVYDHYRFRAIQSQRQQEGKLGWSGFLEGDERWLQAYASGRKGAVSRYFAG